MAEGERIVRIPVDGVQVEGAIGVPPGAKGLVLFAHGSGSSRHSPRNQYVAGALRQRGLGTVLVDLLTAQEEESERLTGHLRFDIRFLARRLCQIARWIGKQPALSGLPLGLFGASTGAAAALVAAAALPRQVEAVVSRGGRPDLAGLALEEVRKPVLLVVGGEDPVVIGLNEEAFSQLRCPKELVIVRGATHLFEEPGTLEQVARLAGDWFSRYLAKAAAKT